MEEHKTDHEADKHRLDHYKKWLSKILPFYDIELKKTQKNLSSFHFQNKHILSQTSFEIMNRHLLEETHSNVIAYFLRSKSGRVFLRAILKSLPELKISYLSIERLNNFKVEREKLVDDGKRIDIWIESGAFVVVIENKFNAKIHMIDKNTSQTDNYYIFTTNYCAQKNKKPFFILLDYKNSEKSEQYQSMDYNDLLNVLETTEKSFQDDLIYKEYVLLLKRLQNNIIGHSINNAEGINSLTALNNLVEVLHNGFTK